MGILMQAFHWDCPKLDNREFSWWNFVRSKIPSLVEVGITSIWLPPVHKAANISGLSMGYDPYDYYDLGEFEQKSSTETWFGSKTELLELINIAHAHDITVVADMVFNHNSGGDATEVNPLNGKTGWTVFQPKSGKFPRDWQCFHPCEYETWDDGTFGDMPDLCHRNPYVFDEILKLSRWLIEDIGFDGFRYDFVKGYGPWMVTAIQEARYQRDGKQLKPYGVGENWSSTRSIYNWLDEINAWTDNRVDAFDFPLRYLLKDLCDKYGFSLRELAAKSTVLKERPWAAVTFADNHDFREHESPPIINDKLLAYSYILTHQGYPCIFWKDYFNWGLGKEGTPNGIAALVSAHENYAGGETQTIWVDDNLYIMQRLGWENNPGLVFVLNNRGDRWNGAWVDTQWRGISFTPVAWWSGIDLSRPKTQWAYADGRAEFWAPPRGYVVYAPQI